MVDRDWLGKFVRRCVRLSVVVVMWAIVAGVAARIICSSWNDRVSRMAALKVSAVVQAPPGRKLGNAMWKDGDLWILTRPAGEGERPDQEWTLDEHSSWGILNNHILLKEMPR